MIPHIKELQMTRIMDQLYQTGEAQISGQEIAILRELSLDFESKGYGTDLVDNSKDCEDSTLHVWV